jgi:hypothetical protein
MPYAACPKCAHAPMPSDQSLPAACPACGLILAKYGAPVPRAAAALALDEEEAPLFLALPDRVVRPLWSLRIFTWFVFAAWSLWIWATNDVRAGEIGSAFLHMILLPFHEAGHYLIFRWFGDFITILGGTLGQHLLPIVAGIALLRQRDPFGAALCLWLLGFSTVDMAIYMYDAFDPKLTLLGGATGQESDGHDWQNLFGDMGLLRRSRGIALFFAFVGYATMVAGLAWAALVLKLQRARISDFAFEEKRTLD